MRTITPIAELGRAPEAGHLRLYHIPKGERFPEPLGFYRATAPTEELLAPIGSAFDKPVVPWAPGGKAGKSDDRFSVDLPAKLHVLLFGRDCVDEAYTLWDDGKKRTERRCDGLKCSVPGETGGLETKDCLCIAQNEAVCALRARLWVALPQATTTALWRVHTGSYQAVGHLSKSAALCRSAAAGAMVADAWLGIGEAVTSYIDPVSGEPRKGRQHFPTLDPMAGDHTVAELRSMAQVRQAQAAAIGYDDWGDAPAVIGTGARQLVAGTPVGLRSVPDPAPVSEAAAGFDGDDEVVDGEIVEDDDDMTGALEGGPVDEARFLELAAGVNLDMKRALTLIRQYLKSEGRPVPAGTSYEKLMGSEAKVLTMAAAVMEADEQPTLTNLTEFAAALVS